MIHLYFVFKCREGKALLVLGCGGKNRSNGLLSAFVECCTSPQLDDLVRTSLLVFFCELTCWVTFRLFVVIHPVVGHDRVEAPTEESEAVAFLSKNRTNTSSLPRRRSFPLLLIFLLFGSFLLTVPDQFWQSRNWRKHRDDFCSIWVGRFRMDTVSLVSHVP